MPKVLVWNENRYPYTETFKGDRIHIPAGQSIEMDADDATLFLGTFSPPVLDADGNPTPQGYKMLRIEKTAGAGASFDASRKIDELRCLACSYKGSSKEDLAEHAKAAHESQLVKDELAEEDLKARKRAKAG